MRRDLAKRLHVGNMETVEERTYTADDIMNVLTGIWKRDVDSGFCYINTNSSAAENVEEYADLPTYNTIPRILLSIDLRRRLELHQ